MTILLFILGVVLAALALILSIALHEVGHLAPAKLFGVKVVQYMVGFGPTLWSRRRGETEYGIKAVPLGGYVAMLGMYPPRDGRTVTADSTGALQQMAEQARALDRERLEDDDDRAYCRLPVWKRVIIMLGGPVMNLLIAAVCFTVLLTGFGVPAPSTTLAEVSQCARTVQAGQDAGADCRPGDPQAPAAAAGLRPGDTVQALDGRPVDSWDQLTETVRGAAGRDLAVDYERDGQRRSTTLRPVLTERPVTDATGQPVVRDGRTATEQVGFIGAVSQQRPQRQPVTQVPVVMGQNMARVAQGLLHLPVNVWRTAVTTVTDAPRDPEGPMSVVGVGRISGELASHEEIPVRDKAAALVNLVAAVNLALFGFNLVPLLPLDGGHALGALWEGLRRRAARLLGRPDPGPFDPLRLLPLTYAVSACLLAMTLVLVAADLIDPVQLF